MILKSPVFENGQAMPAQYTCQGGGIIPPLEVQDVPVEAKSLALIMDDPDSPMGTFDHWLVWNIDPDTVAFPEMGLPQGAIEGRNSSGENGYYPPCPNQGEHRYFFRIFALQEKIHLAPGSTRAELEQVMQGKILSRAELVGKFSRF